MSTEVRTPFPGRRAWSLERVLFAIAGSVTLGTAVLGALVNPWFLALTAFVGANQLLYVVAGDCPMSLVLRRACGLKAGAQ